MAFSSNGSSGDDFTPMAEINIVPLVDVMLVLLIISMITTPFMEQGVNVELPVTKESSSLQKSQQEDPVILFVTKDKLLKIQSQTVDSNDLAKKLKEVFKDKQTKELFVRADKSVPYGVVAEVMARVQAAGIERVGLVTQSE